jgi:aspartate-semialdehyde dehydrogenase
MVDFPSNKIPVTVLGATGTVGQQFVRLLAGHPWFEITAVTGAGQSTGRPYAEATRWLEPEPIPDRIAAMPLRRPEPALGGRITFSALETDGAAAIEVEFARAGIVVISLSGAHRSEASVPLIIPEVNAEHLVLVERQRRERKWPGAIIANPTCGTTGLILAVAPLHRAFGIERMIVTSLQALSGSGYPGLSSLDVLGNVIPLIPGEEERIETETRRLLGQLQGMVVTEAPLAVGVHAHRVPVLDGHLQSVSIGFRRKSTPADAIAVLEGARLTPDISSLPSSPSRPVVVDSRLDRPQPRLDAGRERGMAAIVGRVRACPVLDLRLVVASHNRIRGAAGGAILTAELMNAKGFFNGTP